jgi:prophage regulatory protein
MIENNLLKIQRRPEVLSLFGISKTNAQDQIKAGTLPPPILIGKRCVGWLQHENNAVLAALVAGKNKDERKALVASLIAKRETYLKEYL